MINALFSKILSRILRFTHCVAGVYKDDQNLELCACLGPAFNVDVQNHRCSGLD